MKNIRKLVLMITDTRDAPPNPFDDAFDCNVGGCHSETTAGKDNWTAFLQDMDSNNVVVLQRHDRTEQFTLVSYGSTEEIALKNLDGLCEDILHRFEAGEFDEKSNDDA